MHNRGPPEQLPELEERLVLETLRRLPLTHTAVGSSMDVVNQPKETHEAHEGSSHRQPGPVGPV